MKSLTVFTLTTLHSVRLQFRVDEYQTSSAKFQHMNRQHEQLSRSVLCTKHNFPCLYYSPDDSALFSAIVISLKTSSYFSTSRFCSLTYFSSNFADMFTNIFDMVLLSQISDVTKLIIIIILLQMQ